MSVRLTIVTHAGNEDHRNTLLGTEVDEQSSLVYSFKKAWLRDIGMTVAVSDVTVSLRADDRNHSRRKKSQQLLQVARSPEAIRRFFIDQGIGWTHFPEDAPEALASFRRAGAAEVILDSAFGVTPFTAERFIPADGAVPMRLDDLMRELPVRPFQTAQPTDELALLMQYLQQVILLDRSAPALLDDLLSAPQIPRFWVFLAAAGAGTFGSAAIPPALAPIEGLCEDGSDEDFVASYQRLIDEPHWLGALPIADLVMATFRPCLQNSVKNTYTSRLRRMADVFRILGEGGHCLAPDYLSHMESSGKLSAGAHALAHYRAGRLSHQIGSDVEAPSPVVSL